MSASVVPARAGMSPIAALVVANGPSGPRASGDEPDLIRLELSTEKWSPRERG